MKPRICVNGYCKPCKLVTCCTVRCQWLDTALIDAQSMLAVGDGWVSLGAHSSGTLRSVAVIFGNKVDGSLQLQCCVKILPITADGSAWHLGGRQCLYRRPVNVYREDALAPVVISESNNNSSETGINIAFVSLLRGKEASH